MSLINYFFPRKIHYPDTKYNKKINVIDYGTSATLLSENLIESGQIMAHIWGVGINRLLPKTFVPKTVLLLGLAGGSNAHLINKKYPQAKITGVDIDRVMIDIGRKHFGLDKIKNLTLIVADAFLFVKQLKKDAKYDLVLLDCFIGESIPKKLEGLGFLKKLKDHSSFVLINHLYWHEHRAATQRFMRSLSTKFFFVKTHTRTNTIISLV